MFNYLVTIEVYRSREEWSRLIEGVVACISALPISALSINIIMVPESPDIIRIEQSQFDLFHPCVPNLDYVDIMLLTPMSTHSQL